MVIYVLKRIAISVLTLWIIVTITFFAMKAIPGDPFLDATRVPQEVIENLRVKYGLDQPLMVQYMTYMKNLAKGDLGISLKYKDRSVNDMIARSFPVSATLGLSAAIFGVAVGMAFGIIAGLNNQKYWDYIVVLIAVIGVSVPSFVIASLLQYLFGVKLMWLPVARWGTPLHLILPTFALGLGVIAFQARMLRTSVVEVLREDYIKTARAKGLNGFEIIRRHVLRNSIIPSMTILGPTLAGLITGTFVIEKIFAIPGMGKYYIQSIQESDYTMIMGMTVFYTVILLSTVLLVDLSYGLVDPRIQIYKSKH